MKHNGSVCAGDSSLVLAHADPPDPSAVKALLVLLVRYEISRRKLNMLSIDDARNWITHLLDLWRGQASVMSEKEPSFEAQPLPAKPAQARRSIVLMRLLDADCPSCRGFGCTVCAGTGLG
jgi:hypothetical protein